MTLTNQELNEAIRTAQMADEDDCGAGSHIKALRAEQLRRATAKDGPVPAMAEPAACCECAAFVGLVRSLPSAKGRYRKAAQGTGVAAMTEPNDLKGELAEICARADEGDPDVPCAYMHFFRTHGARLKRALEERDALEKIALECFKAMAKYDPVGAKAFADSLEAARASEQAP